DFAAGRTDAPWLDQARTTVRNLYAEHAAENRTRRESISVPVEPGPSPQPTPDSRARSVEFSSGTPTVSQPEPAPAPPPQPQSPWPTVTKAPEPVAEESSRIDFFRINEALAECRDLTEALKQDAAVLDEIENRQWQLRNRSDVTALEI